MTYKPTVCLAYLWHQWDERLLSISREVMGAYDWVTKIVCLHTRKEQAEFYTADDTRWVSHNYGAGFDQQPEEGGFHEVAARNKLYDLAMESGCDWMLVCDADEFFTPETFSEIRTAHQLSKNIIWFPCYHFCKPDEYVWWPNTVRRRHNSQPMHDPHPRAFRLVEKLPWVMNYNNKFREGLKNRTMHCHVRPHKQRVTHIAQGMYHIHVRHMFDPKRPSPERLATMKKRTPSSGVMPIQYRRIWAEQEAAVAKEKTEPAAG